MFNHFNVFFNCPKKNILIQTENNDNDNNLLKKEYCSKGIISKKKISFRIKKSQKNVLTEYKWIQLKN